MAVVELLPPLQDYIMLCVDTGPSMDSAPLDEGETRLETAVKIASRIVQQKVSFSCMIYAVYFSFLSLVRCLLAVKTL